MENRSSLSDDEIRSIRRTLASELRSAGYRAAPPRATVAEVRIAISENFQSYLWVAQVLRGKTRLVLMVAVPRAPTAPPRSPASLALSRKLLLSREEPMLDLTMIPTPGLAAPRLLVLGSSSVALYEISGGAWQAAQTASVVAAHTWPRDLRGRLAARADGTFGASLPGVRCQGSVNLLANLDCRSSDEPWPVVEAPEGNGTTPFVADRNYFTGPVLLPGNQPLPVPDFYSAAAVENGKDFRWLVATTAGPVRLLGPRSDMAEFHGWGSQLAAIKPACESGRLVLATRPGDFAEPDAVQAYQIRGRAAETASAPVEFTGPVTRLRASSEEGVAFAIVHALPTGLYEAYRLSITCGD